MNTPIWQRLPEEPPTEPGISAEDHTLVLDRDAPAGPPPDPSPRRDSPWWRAGLAALLVAALGGAAWLISTERAGSGPAALGQSPVASTAGPEARPAEPGPGLDSLFEDGALPPEIEALLHDGLDRFRLDEPPPGFEEFFGRDGLPTDPFAPGGPLSDGSPLFDRFFPDGLPEDFNELLDRLPGALSGQGDVEGVRDLINRLLDDPDLPPPLRRLLERFESRLAEAG